MVTGRSSSYCTRFWVVPFGLGDLEILLKRQAELRNLTSWFFSNPRQKFQCFGLRGITRTELLTLLIAQPFVRNSYLPASKPIFSIFSKFSKFGWFCHHQNSTCSSCWHIIRHRIKSVACQIDVRESLQVRYLHTFMYFHNLRSKSREAKSEPDKFQP